MSIHDGHRNRLRKKFKEGNIEDHELLELLLFSAIPRRNTNEIAHRLLENFGSVNGVFNASEKALCSVEGIGKSSAMLIKVVSKCIERYLMPTNMPSEKVDTLSKLEKYIASLFYCATNEKVYVLLFNNSKSVILCRALGEGNACFSEVEAYKILNLAVEYGAASVAIAHNHPNGIAMPSEEDIKITNGIKSALEQMKINFLDHFIVVGDRCVPILNGGYANKDIDI